MQGRSLLRGWKNKLTSAPGRPQRGIKMKYTTSNSGIRKNNMGITTKSNPYKLKQSVIKTAGYNRQKSSQLAAGLAVAARATGAENRYHYRPRNCTFQRLLSTPEPGQVAGSLFIYPVLPQSAKIIGFAAGGHSASIHQVHLTQRTGGTRQRIGP
jgi:hypothetical protein